MKGTGNQTEAITNTHMHTHTHTHTYIHTHLDPCILRRIKYPSLKNRIDFYSDYLHTQPHTRHAHSKLTHAYTLRNNAHER